MSKESYARGFCKVAEEHGIDPVQLAKFAAPAKNAPPTTPAPVSTSTIRKDLIKRTPILVKNILTRPHTVALNATLGGLGGLAALGRHSKPLSPSASDLTKKRIQDFSPSFKTIWRDKMPTPQR